MICVNNLWACDICSAYTRIRPNDFSHTIGLHYNHRYLEGTIPSGLKHLGHINGLFATDLLQESFSILELRARYRVSNKLAFTGIVPFEYNLRFQNQVLRERSQGLGDPILFMEYRPLLPMSEQTFKKVLSLRSGIKFPLGTTQFKYEKELVDHDFQIGTGSYDFFLGAESYFGTEKLGLVASGLYRINTSNLSNYRFGNVLSAACLISIRRAKEDKMWSLAPGLALERQAADMSNEQPLTESYKSALAFMCRADFNYKNVEVYATFSKPLKQEINKLENLPVSYIMQAGCNILINRK